MVYYDILMEYCIDGVASFSGHSHRQYLIASGIKYGGGGPGRYGHVLYCPSNGWMSERSQGRRSIPFVVHNAGDGSMRNRYYNSSALPPVCLPSVYLTSSHVTRSPRPSPAVFDTGSNEILAVGTAWERGY